MNKGTIFSKVAEIVGVCIAQVVTELMQYRNNKKD
mgnify:CR=1 FL=1